MDAVTDPPRTFARASNSEDEERSRFTDQALPHMAAMANLAARIASFELRDDVVQDALAQAWRKRAQFDPTRGTFRIWLLAVTANQARKAVRRRRPPIHIAAPVIVSQIDDRIDVEAAVTRLPPRQRLAVDCYYYVGLSVTETAAVMQCSNGTVKSTLSDARMNLRDLLKDWTT